MYVKKNQFGFFRNSQGPNYIQPCFFAATGKQKKLETTCWVNLSIDQLKGNRQAFPIGVSED